MEGLRGVSSCGRRRRVYAQVSRGLAPMISQPPNLAEIREAVARIASQAPSYDPPFRYSILEFADYDALLSGKPYEIHDVSWLRGSANAWGRVLVHAEGGTGKTSMLWQVLKMASDREEVVHLIDLNSWRSSHHE